MLTDKVKTMSKSEFISMTLRTICMKELEFVNMMTKQANMEFQNWMTLKKSMEQNPELYKI